MLRLAFYGLTMMVGTLFMFRHWLAAHDQKYALTLAFTTFVLFRFFNVFNARAEQGSAFNAGFFANGKLWQALAGVLALQVVVHWGPAQSVFDTVDLSLRDWGLGLIVAATVLFLDEARKYLGKRFRAHDSGR